MLAPPLESRILA